MELPRNELSRKPVGRAGQRLLLLPLAYFAGVLAVALVLAGLNAQFGSANLLPGESLWVPGLILVLLYALSLNIQLLKAGLARSQHDKARYLLLAISTLAATPVLGFFVAPAINGLGALSPATQVEVPVERIEASPVSRSPRLHYYAYLPNSAAESSLPAGRYFMGRYDAAWAPDDEAVSLSTISRVSVRYRTGLLGARTLLEVLPGASR